MHGRIYLKLAGLDYVGEFSSCWVYFAHVQYISRFTCYSVMFTGLIPTAHTIVVTGGSVLYLC